MLPEIERLRGLVVAPSHRPPSKHGAASQATGLLACWSFHLITCDCTMCISYPWSMQQCRIASNIHLLGPWTKAREANSKPCHWLSSLICSYCDILPSCWVKTSIAPQEVSTCHTCPPYLLLLIGDAHGTSSLSHSRSRLRHAIFSTLWRLVGSHCGLPHFSRLSPMMGQCPFPQA